MCADVPCAAACTTGALVHGPIIAFGTARVGARLCLNFGRALDEAEVDGDVEPACERCVDWCPVPGAIALGQDALPAVDAARCTGCGACAAHCAAYPRAIAIQ